VEEQLSMQEEFHFAKEHSDNPTRYLQTCKLCCQYVNACIDEPGAMCFWEDHLEYLHSVASKVNILYNPNAPAGMFEVQVNDMEWMERIFCHFDGINPEGISTSIDADIISCHIYEPDVLYDLFQ